MGWIAAFVMIAAVGALGVTLRRQKPDVGWRDEVQGLRERLQRRA
jgi:hypothetical protein